MITLLEYCRIVDKCESAALKRIQQGQFKSAVKIGGRWYIDENEVWPEKRKVKYTTRRVTCYICGKQLDADERKESDCYCSKHREIGRRENYEAMKASQLEEPWLRLVEAMIISAKQDGDLTFFRGRWIKELTDIDGTEKVADKLEHDMRDRRQRWLIKHVD